MFTGIVQHVGRVISMAPQPGPQPPAWRLCIDACGWSHQPGAGESIAVGGCCLSLADPAADAAPEPRGALGFDIVPQTLSLTTLGGLRAGDRVNLEHAATPVTLLGGHIVQGHVDGIGRVACIERGEEWRLRIEPPPALLPCLLPQGSIAVDGVSLTIAAADSSCFEVALIPATIRSTTLGDRREGDRVNIETDYLARIVIAWLTRIGRAACGSVPPTGKLHV